MNSRALVLLALVVLSCEGPSERGRPSVSPRALEPSLASVPVAESAAPVAGSNRVQQAREDLSAHLGVPVSRITLVREEDVVWPNAGLGCPHQDAQYDEAPVPGYRIVLRHGTLEYHYHGADGSAPFWCQFLE